MMRWGYSFGKMDSVSKPWTRRERSILAPVGRLRMGVTLLAMLAALMLAACGGDESPTPTPAATSTPTPAPATATTVPATTVPPTATSVPATAIPAAEASAFVSPLQAESPLMAPADAPVSPLPTPPAVGEDMGALIGQIVSATLPDTPPLAGEVVWLGMIIWNEDKSDGDFVIDGVNGPATVAREDGTFVITDLNPGDYMLAVGDLIGNHSILTTEEGKAQVFTVLAGEVTSTGTLRIDLP